MVGEAGSGPDVFPLRRCGSPAVGARRCDGGTEQSSAVGRGAARRLRHAEARSARRRRGIAGRRKARGEHGRQARARGCLMRLVPLAGSSAPGGEDDGGEYPGSRVAASWSRPSHPLRDSGRTGPATRLTVAGPRRIHTGFLVPPSLVAHMMAQGVGRPGCQGPGSRRNGTTSEHPCIDTGTAHSARVWNYWSGRGARCSQRPGRLAPGTGSLVAGPAHLLHGRRSIQAERTF